MALSGNFTERFTPLSLRALELSLREALSLGHNYIGTEHLLLGLVRIGEGTAYEVLSSVCDPDELRDQVVSALIKERRGR